MCSEPIFCNISNKEIGIILPQGYTLFLKPKEIAVGEYFRFFCNLFTFEEVIMASRKLEDCVVELQEKIPLIIDEYNETFPTRKLFLVCTLRSSEEQQALYAIGRTIPPIGRKYWVTQIDGVNKFSNHNPIPSESKARAVDLGVSVGGKYITDETFYYPLLELARKHGLISGIDFKNTGSSLKDRLRARKEFKDFLDFPHIEIKK